MLLIHSSDTTGNVYGTHTILIPVCMALIVVLQALHQRIVSEISPGTVPVHIGHRYKDRPAWEEFVFYILVLRVPN